MKSVESVLASLMILAITKATPITISIDTSHAIHKVDEKFLSITIDQNILQQPKWLHFNFSSPKLHTLMSALAPAYLRFGGTSADYAVFTQDDPRFMTRVGLIPNMLQMSCEDWDNLVGLVRSTGLRLLYEFNLQLRYGQQWDPSNAVQMLRYLDHQGYAEHVDFELGNEPDLYSRIPDFMVVNGSRLGDDYVILKKLLQLFPSFDQSIIVGPDTIRPDAELWDGFIKKAGSKISALTIHHYYFKGPGATYNDYINPKHFDTLAKFLKEANDIVHSSASPSLPVWLGETSDAYSSGTPYVSDRYVSGFLWLDKLGLAGSMGIKLVARQAFWGENYALTDLDFNPNPDYWLSLLFKRLVGRRVLCVEQSVIPYEQQAGSNSQTTRVYAHCTAPDSVNKPGAVTVYALSVNINETVTLMFSGSLENQDVDAYLMTGDGPEGLLSKYVALNGQRLKMVDDHTLPAMAPIRMKTTAGILLPPLSYLFIVFPYANTPACQ